MPEKKKPLRRTRRLLKPVLALIFVSIVVSLGSIIFAELYVNTVCKGRLFDKLDDVPERSAGLVLGCSPKLRGGAENPYFSGRMEAAAELLKSGKVAFLILSGDNGERYYNEPKVMRKALVKLGVPGDQMTMDFAGFRTLDSVIRAKEIFGQDGFVVVSQEFHNERAIAVARKNGIDAVGYNAPGVDGTSGLRTKARERLARVKLILDLYVLRKQPKFLGEPVEPPAGTNDDA